MKPGERTHQEDSERELENGIIIFNLLAVVPILIYSLTLNFELTLASEFLLVAGVMDIILTADGLTRGYTEANFYHVLLNRLGSVWGLRAVVALNFAIRAAIIFFLRSFPFIIFLIALSTFAGPLWNILTMHSFRDDIVVQVPSLVSVEGRELEVSEGEKRRLEESKKEDDEDGVGEEKDDDDYYYGSISRFSYIAMVKDGKVVNFDGIPGRK